VDTTARPILDPRRDIVASHRPATNERGVPAATPASEVRVAAIPQENDEDRKRMLLADRLAAIGTLAAGAAHEINNPLTYALINVEHVLRLLRAFSAAGGEVVLDPGTNLLPLFVRSLEQANDGMQRVREIVHNLLTFSSGGVATRTLVDVRAIVESSIQMSMHEIVHRARVVRQFSEVPPVEANEAALGQVFLNLLVNAAQAIPEGDVQQNEVRVAIFPDDGGNVAIEIADTGAGIPADVLPRIFDPFFTANKARGTGLGLSISHGTIAALNGTIGVSSEAGRGSCFRVSLPASARWRSAHLRSGGEPGGALRRVLIVDDDALVAEALARALEGESQVEVITDSREAIARLVAGERWDVILCDLMMAGVSGMAMYGETLTRAPDAAGSFVFMTAGAFTSGARAFVENMPNRCIEKPIDVDRLRELVRRGEPGRRAP
jgi:signal transduction histidine kinase/ActR/RegA family two-component response regulator